ncbi:hypothetical protein J2782_004539, partial [Brucella pseudogrignonensis]|nr:hypothetical protein [Brucella pseudogrignonensis]
MRKCAISFAAAALSLMMVAPVMADNIEVHML